MTVRREMHSMNMDARNIKMNKSFYKLQVAISFARLIFNDLFQSRLSIRSKFYFCLFLFLANQEKYEVSFPRFDNLIKLVLLSKIKNLRAESLEFDEPSYVIKGWRADKKNQIILKKHDQMEVMKLRKISKLRVDVKRVHPRISILSGFESNRISLSKINFAKFLTSKGENGSLNIAGKNNIKLLCDLGVVLDSHKAEFKLDDVLYFDDIKCYIDAPSALARTLMFMVVNYSSLHHLLFAYIHIDTLKILASSLEIINQDRNVVLFKISVLGILSDFEGQKVRKLRYVLDSKSKNSVLPSIIILNSATIYPENILVNSCDEIVNEITLDPRSNFISHLSNNLYCHGLGPNEALIYTNNHDVVKISERVIYLPCNPINNWFHLIFEGFLPLIYNLNKVDKNLKVLIHKNSPVQFKELLHFAGFINYYELEADIIYRLDSIILFESATKIIDSLSNNQDLNSFSISKSSLISTQHFFQKKMEQFVTNRNESVPKKILVLRSGQVRGLVNREALKNYCTVNGYHAIFPDKLTVIEQMSYFYGANEIVLEGGSAMANLIVCKVGTKIKYLLGEITSDYELVSSICSLLRLPLTLISGKAIPKIGLSFSSIYDVFHSNFKINPELVVKFQSTPEIL